MFTLEYSPHFILIEGSNNEDNHDLCNGFNLEILDTRWTRAKTSLDRPNFATQSCLRPRLGKRSDQGVISRIKDRWRRGVECQSDTDL